MPYVRRYSRSRKSSRRTRPYVSRRIRKFKPRRKYSKARALGTSWKNPLPQKGYYKFRYQDSAFSLGVTALVPYASYTWSGNSLFDPDYSGLGVQPYGFDQMCSSTSAFQKYRVIGSKIKIYPHVINENDENIRGIRMILVPTRSLPPTYIEFEDLKQLPKAKSIAMNSVDDCKQFLSSYCTTSFMYPDVTTKDIEFSSYYNANPVQQWGWALYIDGYDSGAHSVNFLVDCQITYYAVLAKTDDVNQS